MADSGPARRHRDDHPQLHAQLTPTNAYSPSGLQHFQHLQLQPASYQLQQPQQQQQHHPHFGLSEYHHQASPKANFYPVADHSSGVAATPLQHSHSYPAWSSSHTLDPQQALSPQLSVEDPAQTFGGDWNLWDFAHPQNLDANAYRSSPHLTPNYPPHEHKRASSASSHASFGPHTPRASVIPRVEVYDSEGHGYNGGAPSTIHWPEELDLSVSDDEVKQFYQVFGVHDGGGLSEVPIQYRTPRDVQRLQDPRIRQLMMSQDSTGSIRMGPPALPRTESTDTDSGCRPTTEPPKLDRTMSDIYADSLYNPNLHQDPSTPPKTHTNTHETSPNAMVMRERLAAANNDHLSAQSQMPAGPMTRQRSPFKEGAPESPRINNFPSESEATPRMQSAYKMREWEKAQRDRAAAAQHGPTKIKSEINEASRTISPKEVALDYEEDEVASKMGSLFSSDEPPVKRRKQEHDSSTPTLKPSMTRESTRGSNASEGSQPSFGSMATSRRESTQSNGRSSMNYPFFAQAQRQASSASNATMASEPSNEFPLQLTSTDSSSRSEERPTSRKRTLTATSTKMRSQDSESADPEELTYTCTYHNCTKRFDSQSALQKHKRDIHHSTAHHSRNTSLTATATATVTSPTTPSSRTGSASVSAAPTIANAQVAEAETASEDLEGDEATSDEIADRNSQAGPHICNRINPSTGRPCNSHFSRPYDLTRHEDTIHNNKKQKVRCMYCKDEKTFSRNDALTRHMRVVHPEVNFAGKEKKSGRSG